MVAAKHWCVSLGLSLAAVACASSKNKGSSDSQAADTGTATDTNTATSTAAATAMSASTATEAPPTFASGTGFATNSIQISQPNYDATVNSITATSYPPGFYTGFDGEDSFGFLLPGYSGTATYSIADTTIATIQSIQVAVSAGTVADLQSAMTTAGIANDKITKAIAALGTTRTMYKITPLKPGNTVINTTQPPGSPSGLSGELALVVTGYTPAQMALGKARYATAHDSENPACASCHLSGKDGAPSHALGDINAIPDIAAATWITTGVLADFKSPIPHAWKFADQDEETGTIAYVRSLETIDPEQLLILEFAQQALTAGVRVTINPNGTLAASAVSSLDLDSPP